jgi:hypothetical protein
MRTNSKINKPKFGETFKLPEFQELGPVQGGVSADSELQIFYFVTRWDFTLILIIGKGETFFLSKETEYDQNVELLPVIYKKKDPKRNISSKLAIVEPSEEQVEEHSPMLQNFPVVKRYGNNHILLVKCNFEFIY